VFSFCKAITLNGFSTPTHPHTSKKHGNRQAESGGQISHRGSLTGNAENEELLDFVPKDIAEDTTRYVRTSINSHQSREATEGSNLDDEIPF